MQNSSRSLRKLAPERRTSAGPIRRCNGRTLPYSTGYTMRVPQSLALVLALSSACTEPASEVDLGEATAAIGACPPLICGNSPHLGAYPFWELDETGTKASSNGLRILSATHGWVPQKLDVIGFKWTRQPFLGAPQSVAGTVIKVGTPDASLTYELTVTSAPSLHYYEGGHDGTVIPAYWISYVAVQNGRRRPPVDLCGKDEGSSLPRPVLVFEGDRYSAETGAVFATGAAVGPWFNVACKDDALWKLALMRYVEAARTAVFDSGPDERMAALRSIRADYCGDGTALTELGTAIDWKNDGGWLVQDGDGSPEAVWGPDGAMCLDETRIPDMEVPCADALPACDDVLDDWQASGSILTLVPAGP